MLYCGILVIMSHAHFWDSKRDIMCVVKFYSEVMENHALNQSPIRTHSNAMM